MYEDVSFEKIENITNNLRLDQICRQSQEIKGWTFQTISFSFARILLWNSCNVIKPLSQFNEGEGDGSGLRLNYSKLF